MKIDPSSFMNKFSRQFLVAKKHSPHIFFVAGVLGSITSTILACRATLKLSDTLDEIQMELDNVEKLKEAKKNSIEASDVDTHVEIDFTGTMWVGRSGLKIVRLYAPSVAVGIAAIGCLTGSHIQLYRRNAALMAAYAAVQKAYDEYRLRVREEVGEEKELDIYHAAESKTIKDEDGKAIEGKVADPSKYSPYAKFFDEGSRHWEKNSELNRLYILVQQRYANDLLIARGHLFLNEVYDMLDVGRTKAGAVVGWVIGKEGDNYVNFGVYEAFNANFVNGHEKSVLLDFNVDGVIYDKI